MKRFFFVILLLFALVLYKPTTSFAQGLGVVFERNPLFSLSQDGYWMPCDSLTRTTQVTNTSGADQIIAVYPENTFHLPVFPDVSSVFEITIYDNYGNTLYGGLLNKKYLSDFYGISEEYPLSLLVNGANVTYFFNVQLDCSLGNGWQNRETGFDLVIGFSTLPLPSITPTPTNTPVPGPTNTPGPGPTNTPGPGPTNTPGPAPTSTPVLGTGGGLGYITYEYGSELIDVPVLGAATSGTPTPKPTKKITPVVSGAATGKVEGAGTCVEPWWWWVVLLIQILLHTLLRQIGRSQSRGQIFFWFILSELIFGFILWKFFCTLLYLLISILIFLIYSYLIHRKTKAVEEEMENNKTEE